ncbi:hypothetical protein C4J81_02045 [Deltaproteobacteria bacterium Smac51]|nr:hypothetical protein C4J81_02045 [Deltaproteobacteria bacterium Smac51]
MKKNGYEGIYDWVCGHLAKADLAECAPHLGLTVREDGKVSVSFFGREYLVDNQGVTPADGFPAGVNHLSLVGHYAMSRGRGEPAGEYVPLWRLSGTIDNSGGFDRSTVSNPLDRKFGSDLTALEQTAVRLGGVPQTDEPSGGLAWVFHAFPKVPIKLIHHPADEEFEAEYLLLFDKSADSFMVFEALGFLSGVFIHEMTSNDV